MIQHQFAHVAITCKDQKKFETFYSKHFGFKRARTIDLGDGKELFFLKDQHGFSFEVFPMNEERPIPYDELDGPQYPGYRHLAFTVEDVDAKLEAMGDEAEISMGPLNFDEFIKGWRTVWIKDPEGNILELSHGYRDE